MVAVSKSLAARPWTDVPISTSTGADGSPWIIFSATQLDSASMSALAAQDSSASVLAARRWTQIPVATSTAANGIVEVIMGATQV